MRNSRRSSELREIEPAAETLVADEEGFRAERTKVLQAVGSDQTGSQAASAAAEVRGELRSVRSSWERSRGDLRRCERTARVARRPAGRRAPRVRCGSVRNATRPVPSRNHWSPRSSCREGAARRRHVGLRGAPVAAQRRRGGGLSMGGAGRGVGTRARCRSRSRRRGTTRRRRWRPRHPARPHRDRRGMGTGGRGRARRVVDRGGRRRSSGGPARARRTAQLRHERRGDRARDRPASPPRPSVGDEVRPHARSSRPGVVALLDGLSGAPCASTTSPPPSMPPSRIPTRSS